MPNKVAWCASGPVGVTGAFPTVDRTIRWFPVGDAALSRSNPAEAAVQVIYRTPGTWSGLAIVVLKNTLDGTTIVNFRNSGVNGNQTISIAAGATGTFTDAGHSDVSAAGDKLSLQVDPVTNTTSGGIVYVILAGLFLASGSATIKKYLSGGVPASMAFGLTRYTVVGGADIILKATESQVQTKVTQTEIFANACALVSANTLDGATVMTLRQNGSGTAVTMTFPAGSTTPVEDTVHTVTLSAADLIDWQIDTTASSSGAISLSVLAVEASCASGAVRSHSSHDNTGGITQGFALGGDINKVEGGVPVGLAFGVSLTVSKLQVVVFSNTSTDDTLIDSWINGAPGNLTVTVPAGATGIFEDAVNSDALGPTDNMSFILATSGANCQISSVNSLVQGPFISNAPSRKWLLTR